MKWRLPNEDKSDTTAAAGAETRPLTAMTASSLVGSSNSGDHDGISTKINNSNSRHRHNSNDYAGDADEPDSSSSQNDQQQHRQHQNLLNNDNNNNFKSSYNSSSSSEKIHPNTINGGTDESSSHEAQSSDIKYSNSSSAGKTNDDTNTNPQATGASSSSAVTKVIDDDAGNDHAEPPATPWTPQNTPSTCDFTHTISDYAQKRESGCKKAEYSAITVDDNGNRWRLIVYVNGNGRASNHHLSLFLQVADAEDLPFGWKKGVSYVLTLEHPIGSLCNYAKRNPDKTFKMCPKAIDWGWSQFITSDRIQQEGFIQNDSLIVKASVTVKTSSVDIDEEDSELYLKCAVEEGDAKAVKLCLEQGASVNCQFKDDLYTPLHTACSSGSNTSTMDVLNLLLEQGADGNACNKWKETPLLIAANNGNRAAVEALLKHGADPSLCSEAGWSALTFAAHKGYDEIVYLLLKSGAPANCRVTEDASTPLHKACAGSKAGHHGCVQLLINNGADVHALNKWRETPLLTAANHGQALSAMALLEAGADPCKCTDTGWSPLSIAAYKGHDDVVRLLLEEGAPTEEDDPTLSALLQAATKGLPSTVELLLRHGADHTVTTKKGDTALSILVEQNLIDSAVELVTAYNASIPRCSRDRKKVQRARLLINLRMKQLERECRDLAMDDDETDDDDDYDTFEELPSPLHDDNSNDGIETSSKGGKRQKKNKVSPDKSAEDRARAAEEALLRELEKEDAKAKKEEAEANSKKEKKRKKKEKERQQKLKEEQERRKKEEEEESERQRRQRDRDERERERRLREHREREEKEWLEHEQLLETRRKEKEMYEKEQKGRDSASQKAAQPSITPVNSSEKKSKVNKNKQSVSSTNTGSVNQQPIATKDANHSSPPFLIGGNRRWETRAKAATQQGSTTTPPSIGVANGSLSPSTEARRKEISRSTVSQSVPNPASPSSGDGRPQQNLDSVKGRVLHFSDSDSNKNNVGSHIVESTIPVFDEVEMEHPIVVLTRRELLTQLLRQCAATSSAFDERILRRVVYKWILRSSHSELQYTDPLIPSWLDKSDLVDFLMRQFVSETYGQNIDFGLLKQASTAMTDLCLNAASELWKVKQNVISKVGHNWNDASLGLAVSEDPSQSQIKISYRSYPSITLSSSEFVSLRDRFVGPGNKFLSSIYCVKVWYQTVSQVTTGSGLDMRIPVAAMSCFSVEAAVSAEFWSTPFTVLNSNVFWGKFQSIDSLFGGQPPFSKSTNTNGDHILAQVGGSIVSLLPPDSIVAKQYMNRLLDILSSANQTNVALSFLVLIPSDSCPDTLKDVRTLLTHFDPRLGGVLSKCVQRAEVLPEKQHCFIYGDLSSSTRASPSKSLMLLLQSENAKLRINVSNVAWTKIVTSLLYQPVPMFQNDPFVPSIPFPNGFNHQQPAQTTQGVLLNPTQSRSAVPESPMRSASFGVDFPRGSDDNKYIPSIPNSESLPRSRRGRLFDLVDDGEEDSEEQVDIVSGMLNTLDMGLFNAASDVDIEAISLMGIGGHSSNHKFPRSSSGPFR